MVHFGNDWDTILDGEFAKTYYQNLRQFLLTEYRTQTIYPGMYDIFNALKYTPYSQVRAVIPIRLTGSAFPCGKAWLRRRRW